MFSLPPPWLYRVFSHDVTAAILVSQNNETAAMLVSQTSPPHLHRCCPREWKRSISHLLVTNQNWKWQSPRVASKSTWKRVRSFVQCLARTLAPSLQLCDSSDPELASRVTAANQVLQFYLQEKNTRYLITTSVVVTTLSLRSARCRSRRRNYFWIEKQHWRKGGEIYCILAEVFVSVVKILSKYGGTLTSLCDGYRWESGHCLCVKGGVKRKELKTEEIL